MSLFRLRRLLVFVSLAFSLAITVLVPDAANGQANTKGKPAGTVTAKSPAVPVKPKASLSPASTAVPLPDGIWQARILRSDGQQTRFNFETRDSAGKQIIYVMNGKERLLVDQLKMVKDSVYIDMPFFDSHFALKHGPDSSLAGIWIKISGPKRVETPFQASFNQPERFEVKGPADYNISGRWSAWFGEGADTSYAIGEFRQSGNAVTGTFLTSTGDYRFLQGVVDGDSLKLSTFDGGHAYSFTALLSGRDSLTSGHFFAGATSKENWTAVKDEKAKLPDEFSIARLKDASKRHPVFSFRSIDGKMVSLADPVFKNKVVVIQIMGSWCPNCMDETRFLSEFYRQNKRRGVEFIALAYERTSNFETSRKSLESFRKRFNVTYPVLVTGVTVSDSLLTEKTLPLIEQIKGFPTTIFIDRNGDISQIETGFNGPGTGDHYEIFKQLFAARITAMLAK